MVSRYLIIYNVMKSKISLKSRFQFRVEGYYCDINILKLYQLNFLICGKSLILKKTQSPQVKA